MRNGGLASVRPHCHRDRAPIALHLQGDPPEPGTRAWTARNLPAQPDRTSAPAQAGAPPIVTPPGGTKRDVAASILARRGMLAAPGLHATVLRRSVCRPRGTPLALERSL